MSRKEIRRRKDQVATAAQYDHRGKPLDLLRACGGYYECPRDTGGNRLGPLVGYAGRDELGQQYVGDVYVNFAMAERYGIVLGMLAGKLQTQIIDSLDMREIDGFCGAPEGGKALAVILAQYGHMQYIFPEKKVAAVATEGSREKSELVFGRHEPAADENWIIVEDVCNNFSTTSALVALIEKYGARCAGIACFLDRSAGAERGTVLHLSRGEQSISLPVISLVQKPFPQYRQGDPEVATDVRAGNVVWKPKNEWQRLAAAMAPQKQ